MNTQLKALSKVTEYITNYYIQHLRHPSQPRPSSRPLMFLILVSLNDSTTSSEYYITGG